MYGIDLSLSGFVPFRQRSAAMAQSWNRGAALTEVELTSIEGRLEQWIRFGRVAAERFSGGRTRIQAFHPGAIFSFVSRSTSDLGADHASIQILAAPAPGAPCSHLPYVRPGAHILLRTEERQTVDRVLAAIEAVEAANIDPCDAAPEHWRHIASCLASESPVRPYTAERHAAWLRRRAVEG